MVHGSGGQATGQLIDEVFAAEFRDQTLDEMEDSALVPGAGQLALTTDSFVVTPVRFRGGDIGRLAVCGTVNDLLMRGAVPKYLTCGWILQEGTDMELVREMAHSMARTAREAGIRIVAGDTKVIEGSVGGFTTRTLEGMLGPQKPETPDIGTVSPDGSGIRTGQSARYGETDSSLDGGILINTAGVGFVPAGRNISAGNAQPGDAILVSGTMGDHHAAILSERMSIKTDIRSDNAPLTEMVSNLLRCGIHVRTLRDVTRGGLGTVLKELAEASGRTFELQQNLIPVSGQVQDFCSLLGLDPVYMGNEGKLVAVVPADEAEKAVQIMHNSKYGEHAALIGHVTDSQKPGTLLMRTEIGGIRLLDVLQGEGLPRIC